MKIRIIDLTGQCYDAGMIQEVVEVIDDPEMPEGRQIIEETVSPTITLNNTIAQAGQISLRRSSFSKLDSLEVSV